MVHTEDKLLQMIKEESLRLSTALNNLKQHSEALSPNQKVIIRMLHQCSDNVMRKVDQL